MVRLQARAGAEEQEQSETIILALMVEMVEQELQHLFQRFL
jgi:hypothetical protein